MIKAWFTFVEYTFLTAALFYSAEYFKENTSVGMVLDILALISWLMLMMYIAKTAVELLLDKKYEELNKLQSLFFIFVTLIFGMLLGHYVSILITKGHFSV